MNKNLTSSFLQELFKLLFLKKSVIQICSKHFKYQFIPKELPEYKLIFKSVIMQYQVSNKLPSIGIISQQYIDNIDVQQAISDIKDAPIIETDLIIKQLEQYIRNIEFQIMNDHIVDLYQQGKQEEAINVTVEESQRIQNISLLNDAGNFIRLFKDFNKENEIRKEENHIHNNKVPFYIAPLDEVTHGGLDEGDLALWIMRSGIGKSTALKWTGLQASMVGYKVLHFQLEGSKKEARDKYSQIFTKLDYNTIRFGNIPKRQQEKINKIIKQMSDYERDLYIYGFEKFGEPTMADIRDIVIEYQKITGSFPELIIIDSLDLLSTGIYPKIDKDPAYLKQKLQRVAQLMKNLCIEFNTRILTATQTGNVPPQIWNNSDKVIDRSMTEGDRTLVKPFSFVFTGNVTNEEFKNKMMRIYIDKLRNYNPKDQIYPICTDYDKGAFYHNKRTIEKFYNKDL